MWLMWKVEFKKNNHNNYNNLLFVVTLFRVDFGHQKVVKTSEKH